METGKIYSIAGNFKHHGLGSRNHGDNWVGDFLNHNINYCGLTDEEAFHKLFRLLGCYEDNSIDEPCGCKSCYHKCRCCDC